MNKTNNNLMSFSLLMLTILFSGALFANHADAATSVQINGYNPPRPVYSVPNHQSITINGYTQPREVINTDSITTSTQETKNINATPIIYSVSPNSIKSGSSKTTATIYGDNFIPSSVAKWNSSIRQTTYINSSQLLVTLTEEDLKGLGEYLITVYNGNPGGGYSNSIIFTVGDVSAAGTTTTSNLAGSAILAGFLPFSLIGWLIIAILILLGVILWRKVYLNEERKNAPLKHA